MNITLSLNVFGWRIGAFDIRVDMDAAPGIDSEVPGAAATPTLMDAISDYATNRFVRRRLLSQSLTKVAAK